MRILRWAGRLWTAVLVVCVVLAAMLLGARALLPLTGSAPSLRAVAPPDGAANVALRAPLALTFDTPMNPPSVVAALQISPTLRWEPGWDAAGTTLTISPTEALSPDAEYQLVVGEGALSWRFHPLGQPIRLRFRTAQAPAVVAALPPDGAADVPLDSPIGITFSRTIVPPAALREPRALPELRFDPPIAGRATWIDQATVLFRPDAPLLPGTRYRATLDAGLADVSGGQLGREYSWSFSTPAPRVLGLQPADGARLVPPQATIALTISQPLALDALRATLVFSPAISGPLVAASLPGGQQLVTLTPSDQLRPGTTYTATLQAGAAPAEGNLPLIQPVRWRFATAPQPSLSARFPGEGQTLPADQEIRLVFNTPMDAAAVHAALRIEPAAGDLRVSASDAEVRIGASLRAATVYTLTLPASLADRNGIALGQEYRMRFLSAPAGPALELPDVAGHVAQAAPGGPPAGLRLRRTNLSALDIELYQLDDAALLRALAFSDDDWAGFQPERYGQKRLRAWRMPLSDPLNTPVDDRLPLATDAGAPLPAGAYYLRVRTLEGPRADVLLLVSRARLALQFVQPADTGAALVWATDIITGTPLAGLPVALYQGGALVQQATTDAQGLARFGALSGPAAYVALAGGPQIGAVAADLRARADRPARLFLAADRPAYYPGDTIRLAGFVRAAGAAPALSASLRGPGSMGRLYQAALQPGPTGAFSATVALPPDAVPGAYTLSATADGAASQLDLAVRPRPATPLRLEVRAPPQLTGGDDVPVSISLATAEGLPVAGATISWTLDVARDDTPPADGFVFGDDERTQLAPQARAGVSQTDANGRLQIDMADLDLADVPLRYRFVAQASAPDASGAAGQAEFRVAPARRMAGVRPLSRIFTAGQPGTVDLLALDAAGQPAPRTPLRIEVYRRSWERAAQPAQADAPAWAPNDQIAFSRSAVTGPDGRVSLPITLPGGGMYRLRVSTPEGADNAVYSAVSLWASAPGFARWGELPGGGLLLVADKAAYRPGETATLLLAGAESPATVLIARGGAGGPAGLARTVRAGETLTLTVEPGDAPALPVVAMVAARARRPNDAATLAPLPVASAILPIENDQAALRVTITPDRHDYQPGATATITITTSDPAGNGVPADVLLAVGGQPAVAASPLAEAFRPLAAQLLMAPGAAAQLLVAQSARAGSPLAAQPAEGAGFWNPALRTDTTGLLTVTLQLPRAPATLFAQAWAASAERAGEARASLAISQPLDLRVIVPPALRAGDEVLLVARLSNSGPQPHAVEAQLDAQGLALQPGASPVQQAAVAPGETRQLAWRVRVLGAANASGSIAVRIDGAPFQTMPLDQPILPAPAAGPAGHGLALLREYLDPQTGRPLDVGQLRAGQLVRARLTLLSTLAGAGLALDEAIPAGAVVVQAPSGLFDQVSAAPGGLALVKSALSPGILQFEYTLRLANAGRFGVPAPVARLGDAPPAYGTPSELVVGEP